jgi:tripartite-type tricarboxylate transporter receptor subunit TctC
MTTSLTRRQVLALTSAFGLASPIATLAQTSGTTRMVVGFPAGGTADSLARVVAPLMAQPGHPVIVENKPGASGQLAADAVRQAVSDGTSMLLTPSSILSLVPHLYKKPMYDSLRDFTPVGSLCDHSFGFAVQGSSPFQTLADFLDWAKKNPKDASFATPGPGTAPHFLGTVMGRESGTPLVHVPYRGVTPGLQDVMGGQIASTFNPLPTLLEFHRSGRIRILAVTNPTRVSSLPSVPTFNELNLPALNLVEWYGLFVSSKTPLATVEKLSAQLSSALVKPELTAAAKRLEVEPRPSDSAGLKRLLEADIERWEGIVKTTGISLDT